MRWEDERYVRLYTRDTPEWLALGWQARALFEAILRRVDRAGILKLGKAGMKGLAGVVLMPLDVVREFLPELLEDGCIEQHEDSVLVPNFIVAQETRSNDAQRKRDQRERDRDALRSSGEKYKPAGLDIIATLERHQKSPAVTLEVTSGHQKSPAVTLSCAVPNRAVPSRTGEEGPPGKFSSELERVFLEEKGHPYDWDYDSEQAVRRLLKHDEAEVLRRWRNGLRRTAYPRINTIYELSQSNCWNACARDEQGTGGTRASLRANTSDEEFRKQTAHLKTDANGDLVLE